MLASSCATVQSPDGGPKDTQPPRLLAVEPPNESLNFNSKKIVFTFDEFLKTTELGSKVFVSPLIEPQPAAYAQNKKVHIRLPDSLARSTTYVITLFEGIKDDNEGNALTAPIRYAFSTGSELDSGRVSGQVVDAWSGKPVSGWLAALYDSLPDGDYKNKKPKYISLTDASGRFELSYLKKGGYRLIAFEDQDRNFQLSQANEGLALLENDDIEVDSNRSGIELRAFRPDEQPPRLKGISRPTPFSLLLEFDETVEAGVILEIDGRSDTLRQHPKGPASRLLAAWPDSSHRDSVRIKLKAVVDTVGNRRDTICQMKWPKAQSDSLFSITRLDTVKDLRRRVWMSNAPLDFSAIERGLRVLTADSQAVNYSSKFDPPFRFEIELGKLADTVQHVMVTLDSTVLALGGLRLSQPFREKWITKDFSRAGSLSGQWVSEDQTPVVIELYNFNTKEITRTYSKLFKFKDLLPAPYQIRVLIDSDGNGRWTPGRLHPRRMPERWHVHPELIAIKAGSIVENITIVWPP